MIIKVVIPAHNEQDAIALVIGEIPAGIVDEVVVADNCSTDETAQRARAAGATVIDAPERGYGAACLAGLAYLATRPHDAVVFLDGDHSDYPELLGEVIGPLLRDEADMVIGSRRLGEREAGALLPQQIMGNALATILIELLFRQRYTDLGPFRAITRTGLEKLRMRDRNFGWTVEMQVKAILAGLRITEVPVPYRCRIGQSKIAGTVSGTVKAGYKILYTIGWLFLRTTILNDGPRALASRSRKARNR